MFAPFSKDANQGDSVGGIYPALMTGYELDGSVSTPRTLALVDRLIDAGVHGLFIGGTAGEGPVQSVRERIEIIEHVASHVGTSTPFIVHAGSMVYADTLAIARVARDAGAEQIAAIPPLFYNLSADALADYFRQLADDLGQPVMIYHIPSLTHRNVDARWILTLADEGVLSGVKYSADDMSVAHSLIERAGEGQFRFFSGSDPQCLNARSMGGSGAVGVSINAMPELFVALWNAAVTDAALAVRAQETITRFVADMFRYDFIGYLRHVLLRQGFDLGPNRIPLPELSGPERRQIDETLARHADLAGALDLAS